MSNQFEDAEMQEIFEGYLVETQELLDKITDDLMTVENDPENLDLINTAFRSFHTIKGTSSFMGFDHVASITHHAEDLLNKLRRAELKVNNAIIDVLLDVQDMIQNLVNKIKEGDDDIPSFDELISRIDILKDQDDSVPSDETITPTTEISNIIVEPVIPSEMEATEGKVNSDVSAVDSVLSNPDIASAPGDFTEDELSLLDKAFAEVNNTLQAENLKNIITESKSEISKTESNEKVSVTETTPSKSNDENQKDHKSDSNDNSKNAAGKKPKGNSETIRIDVERVESLMDLSGELVLGRNRLQQLTEVMEQEFKNKDILRDLIESTAQIDFVTTEIQSAVMRMRMVPVGKLYQKAPRIVRDLSREFGKIIKLEVFGEETEIDRGIIEELNDPLVHMIRNSCDHGIESPEIRKKLGKPEQGTITLDAEQEGNNIVLKISDDGAGMDPEKLKAKAIEKGLISQEQASQMGDREAYQLIFAPGFSTAKKVTSVSGRGVGMDVVRTNIQNLKGMVEIDSEYGMGSTFIIKLPLTLAIIQGLLVKVSNETFAIPLSSVIEVVAVNTDEVYTINQQEVIRIRQEVLPITRLDEALHIPSSKKGLDNRYVVNVGIGIQRLGLVVDELLGQQEIVIKSLGQYLGSISGIAGSTILGDGRVIMIIDVAQIVHKIYKNEYISFKE